jgi:signal transduction histidine kinase
VTGVASAPDMDYLRTEFLERIAHDLRGPAGVTLGALDEIERTLGPNAEELQPMLRMARRGLRRILRSAERLDRTSQLEAKSRNWETATHDLGVLVRQVLREVQLTEGRDRVTVDQLGDATPCVAAVNVTWVRAALGEIVSNAIHFARARVVIETRETETEVEVVISDDGPGFAGTYAPRFVRLGEAGGLGLSLPIVQDVVRAHGGRIEFRDRRHEKPTQSGTVVTMAFPGKGTPARGDP